MNIEKEVKNVGNPTNEEIERSLKKFWFKGYDNLKSMKDKKALAILEHIYHIEQINQNTKCHLSFSLEVNIPVSTLKRGINQLKVLNLIIVSTPSNKRQRLTYSINHEVFDNLIFQVNSIKSPKDRIIFMDNYFGVETYKSFQKVFQDNKKMKEVEMDLYSDVPLPKENNESLSENFDNRSVITLSQIEKCYDQEMTNDNTSIDNQDSNIQVVDKDSSLQENKEITIQTQSDDLYHKFLSDFPIGSIKSKRINELISKHLISKTSNRTTLMSLRLEISIMRGTITDERRNVLKWINNQLTLLRSQPTQIEKEANNSTLKISIPQQKEDVEKCIPKDGSELLKNDYVEELSSLDEDNMKGVSESLIEITEPEIPLNDNLQDIDKEEILSKMDITIITK